MAKRDRKTGVRYNCTCQRHKHSLLCDHVYRHITVSGIVEVREVLPTRARIEFYRSQYPDTLPSYRIPSMSNLQVDKTIFLPTCCLPKAGRPKKKRYVGSREKAVMKAKAEHAKSLKKGKTKNKRKEKGKMKLKMELNSAVLQKPQSMISAWCMNGGLVKIKNKVKVSHKRQSLKKSNGSCGRVKRMRKRKIMKFRDSRKKFRKLRKSRKDRSLRGKRAVKKTSRSLKRR